MGQEGVVTAVLRKQNRIIIEGVNMVSLSTVAPLSSIPIKNRMQNIILTISQILSSYREGELSKRKVTGSQEKWSQRPAQSIIPMSRWLIQPQGELFYMFPTNFSDFLTFIIIKQASHEH